MNAVPEHPEVRSPWSRSERRIPRTVVRPLQQFVGASTSSGYVLLVAVAAALVWANSPWSDGYERLWDTPLVLRVGDLAIGTDVRFWIGDGLMTLFFLVVGLEIKREATSGDLRRPRALALPAIAAAGGMAVPALLYLAVAGRGPGAHGWAIPMATDIALALGALALAGAGAPPAPRPWPRPRGPVAGTGRSAVVSGACGPAGALAPFGGAAGAGGPAP